MSENHTCFVCQKPASIAVRVAGSVSDSHFCTEHADTHKRALAGNLIQFQETTIGDRPLTHEQRADELTQTNDALLKRIEEMRDEHAGTQRKIAALYKALAEANRRLTAATLPTVSVDVTADQQPTQ